MPGTHRIPTDPPAADAADAEPEPEGRTVAEPEVRTLPEPADGDEEFVRVSCPDCARPIALAADGGRLPEHVVCPTPWNPFGIAVCPGSGREVDRAGTVPEARRERAAERGVLRALPPGLDWRTQPFSHAGGARPMVRQRRPAA